MLFFLYLKLCFISGFHCAALFLQTNKKDQIAREYTYFPDLRDLLSRPTCRDISSTMSASFSFVFSANCHCETDTCISLPNTPHKEPIAKFSVFSKSNNVNNVQCGHRSINLTFTNLALYPTELRHCIKLKLKFK